MSARIGLMAALFVTLAIALALVVTARPFSDSAMALPESAQARYYDITVVSADGKQIELPEKVVRCPLDVAVSAVEGLYRCPAPYDIEELLEEAPQVLAVDPTSGFDWRSIASALALVEVDAGTLVYGLPTNSWQTVQIEYGLTLNSANVLLGAELTNGETGHIENTAWPEFTRGVHPSSFYYRAKTNSYGYLGTEWLARGTQ
jgi:hypothetical protein